MSTSSKRCRTSAGPDRSCTCDCGRTTYDDAELDAWARRLVPFLDDGMDAYVLFRHDVDGTSAIHAEEFAARVERVRASG